MIFIRNSGILFFTALMVFNQVAVAQLRDFIPVNNAAINNPDPANWLRWAG